jgi:hypothetical protein
MESVAEKNLQLPVWERYREIAGLRAKAGNSVRSPKNLPLEASKKL